MKDPRLTGLYAITSARVCADERALSAAAQDALQGGARLLQYRDKDNAPALRARLALLLRDLCRRQGALLIVNDDLDLAERTGADGVHLGAQDADIAGARRRLGPNAVIGASCGPSLARADAAVQAGASYVAFGRFFPSRTKPAAPAATVEVLRQAQRLPTPLCAIGGVTPQNAAPLIAAGADMIAAVEGVFGAPDIVAAAQAYARLF